MKQDVTLTTKVEEVCKEHQLLDPTRLLIGLTNGVDLRKQSAIYKWLIAFEEQFGENEAPDEIEFEQLKEIIKEEAKYAFVTLDQSLTAQKTLLEYMHPKKKSVDLTANVSSTAVTPLKASEIRRFKRKFDAKC